MTESFQPAGTFEAGANTGENFRDGLVADYLCAATPAGEKKALKALRGDEFRLAMAGMTPEQREMWNTLDKVDWKAVQREGLTAVMPLLFGAYLGLTMDTEAATKLTISIGAGGIILTDVSAMARLVETHSRFPRESRLAKAVAAVRIGAFYAGKVGLFAALGTGAGALVHRGWEAQATVSAGGGEGFNNPHPIHRPVVEASGEFGALQPPAETGGVAAGVGPGGASPAEELQQMADAAQGAAEMAARQAALEAATRTVMVNPGDTLTGLIDAAGGNAYGKDFTDTVLQSANILTGPQNPNRDMAKALIDFIKANPDGVNWRDAINGVGDLARQTVGGLPLKDAIAQATRMIYPGQEMKIVVGAGVP